MERDVLVLLERIAVALEKIAVGISVHGESACNGEYEYGDYEEYPEESLDDDGECSTDYLIEALAKRRISVKSIPDIAAVEPLDNIALFMGDKYAQIKRIYELVKKSLNVSPYKFSVCMKNWTQPEISYSCQLCTMLYQIAFLSEYKYDKSPRFILHISPNRIPDSISFLTGHWLEYYVKSTVLKILRNYSGVRYSYIVNPQVILPNGNDFELDDVFMINGEIFWIEAKTGVYQNYVQKYSKVSRIMGLKRNRTFMVLSDLPQKSNVSILENMFSMSVVSVEEFKDVIGNVIRDYLENYE